MGLEGTPLIVAMTITAGFGWILYVIAFPFHARLQIQPNLWMFLLGSGGSYGRSDESTKVFISL
jgi:hypothetical protein